MDKGIPCRSFAECWRRRALFEELKLTSGIPQGSVLGTLLFLAFVNDVWKNLEPTIKLFADDCIIYRKVIKVSDVETLQIDLDTSGEWEVGESNGTSFWLTLELVRIVYFCCV
jgi:hypothetical protein